jgi:hypothetical protein
MHAPGDRAAAGAGGALSVACAVLFAWHEDVRAVVPYAAVAWGLAVLALPTPKGPAAAWALAVRLPLLFCAPTLSDDVWRYVWEGEVWRAGFNPFVHAPDAPVLASLRDATWERVAHRSVPTVYPPAAQALFVLLAPGGVLAWRLFSAGCDVVTAHMLARRDPRAGALWALLPLPALETAVSGHLEGPGVLCLVLALGGSGAAAAIGAMVKLLPGVLLLRERPLRAIAWGGLVVACWIPMIRLDGLRTYATTWAYNGSLFPLVEQLAGAATRPLLQVVGAAVVIAAALRTRDRGRLALWTSGALVILSPVVHPWYALWPLAAALWNGMRAWTLLAALLPLSYVVLATYDPATSSWQEPVWARWAIYLPFYAALLAEALARVVHPHPAPAH